jgi:hypothetical protein
MQSGGSNRYWVMAILLRTLCSGREVQVQGNIDLMLEKLTEVVLMLVFHLDFLPILLTFLVVKIFVMVILLKILLMIV